MLTFKDLKKRVSLQTTQGSQLFERVKDKPIWIWNIEEHKQEDIIRNGSCCFNYVVGLSIKGRRGNWRKSIDNKSSILKLLLLQNPKNNNISIVR